MKFYEAKKAKSLTAEQQAFLATTTKKFPATAARGQWHSLLVAITGETVTVRIDGKQTGLFPSVGFAHPTKRMLRLAVPRSAVVDDVKNFAQAPVAQ